MISRQLLTVLKSEPRIVRREDGVGIRSPAHPQRIEAICDRCASMTMVLSGPPDSEVQRPVVCACGNVWTCTVKRGPLGGEITSMEKSR